MSAKAGAGDRGSSVDGVRIRTMPLSISFTYYKLQGGARYQRGTVFEDAAMATGCGLVTMVHASTRRRSRQRAQSNRGTRWLAR